MISVIVVARNEERLLEKCLGAIEAQDITRTSFEIIVVDSASEDGTRAVAERFAAGSSTNVRILDNPGRYLAIGWNIAVRNARGEFVIRLDAHAQMPRDFLRSLASSIQIHPDCDCVGGAIDSKGTGTVGRIIAGVVSHPFGVGRSLFRTSKTYRGYADTVPYGLYRARVFQSIGPFDERLHRAEDLDMHVRMRKAGMRFWLDASIRTTYYTRSSLRSLVRKAFGDGYWAAIVTKKHRTGIPLRQVVPLCFLGYVAVVLPLYRVIGVSALIPLVLYAALCALSAIHMSIGHRSLTYLLSTVVFPVYHLSKGVGSLCGFLSPASV